MRPIKNRPGLFLQGSQELQRLGLCARRGGAGQLVVIAADLAKTLDFLVYVQGRAPARAGAVVDADAIARDDTSPTAILTEVEKRGAARLYAVSRQGHPTARIE